MTRVGMDCNSERKQMGQIFLFKSSIWNIFTGCPPVKNFTGRASELHYLNFSIGLNNYS